MNTDLFGTPTLVGLKVRLDRPVDRERLCCRNVCVIGAGQGPHAGALNCADCGQHRGWLSKSTAQWIEHVVTRFGAPTTPIVVRKSHTYDEEAPPAEASRSGGARMTETKHAAPVTTPVNLKGSLT
jgi:hypothetical protein